MNAEFEKELNDRLERLRQQLAKGKDVLLQTLVERYAAWTRDNAEVAALEEGEVAEVLDQPKVEAVSSDKPEVTAKAMVETDAKLLIEHPVEPRAPQEYIPLKPLNQVSDRLKIRAEPSDEPSFDAEAAVNAMDWPAKDPVKILTKAQTEAKPEGPVSSEPKAQAAPIEDVTAQLQVLLQAIDRLSVRTTPTKVVATNPKVQFAPTKAKPTHPLHPQSTSNNLARQLWPMHGHPSNSIQAQTSAKPYDQGGAKAQSSSTEAKGVARQLWPMHGHPSARDPIHSQELKAKDAEIELLKARLNEQARQTQVHEETIKAKDSLIVTLKNKLHDRESLVQVLQNTVHFKEDQLEKLMKKYSDVELERDRAQDMADELLEKCDECAETIKELKQKSSDDAIQQDNHCHIYMTLLETQHKLRMAEVDLQEALRFQNQLVDDLGVRSAERNMFELGFFEANRRFKNKELELMDMTEKTKKLEEELKEARDLLEEYRQNDELEVEGFEFD